MAWWCWIWSISNPANARVISASRDATGRQPVDLPGRLGEAPDRVLGVPVCAKSPKRRSVDHKTLFCPPAVAIMPPPTGSTPVCHEPDTKKCKIDARLLLNYH